MAAPERLELPTVSFEGCRSIQLSYGAADNTENHTGGAHPLTPFTAQAMTYWARARSCRSPLPSRATYAPALLRQGEIAAQLAA